MKLHHLYCFDLKHVKPWFEDKGCKYTHELPLVYKASLNSNY
jgi:hypothetical protein